MTQEKTQENNPTSLRLLNQRERDLIYSMYHKEKITDNHVVFRKSLTAKVSYERMQGGFCICIIYIVDHIGDSAPSILRGASRRSYKDPRNDVRGEMLAFSRAVLYSRPVDIT